MGHLQLTLQIDHGLLTYLDETLPGEVEINDDGKYHRDGERQQDSGEQVAPAVEAEGISDR